MKKNILYKLLLSTAIFVTITVQSQSNHMGYAVTDSTMNGSKWHFLRNIDLRNGTYSTILLRLLTGADTLPLTKTNPTLYNGVAAIAHDKKNKRLYFTPMFTDRLSYVDLKTMRIRTVANNFTALFPKEADQSNIITRMVIADDDYGYALTNDGRHLIRFSTENNHVKDLGSLVDDPSNREMSVHNTCSSFGGDIVADDDNRLYLITSRNHVFKINTRTKVAKYLGTVSGIPANFITSGVSVDQREEKLVLVSSVDASDVYILDPNTLVAKGLRSNKTWYAADLANSSVLKTKNYHNKEQVPELFVDNDNETKHKIQLYPNPVTVKEFKINFTDVNSDNYTIKVTDVNGRSIIAKAVTVTGKNNIVPVTLPTQINSGIYLVRVIDAKNKTLYSGKILVQ